MPSQRRAPHGFTDCTYRFLQCKKHYGDVSSYKKLILQNAKVRRVSRAPAQPLADKFLNRPDPTRCPARVLRVQYSSASCILLTFF